MKRFWKAVSVEAEGAGFQVALDGRRVKTQGGQPQIVPRAALAQALAAEWAGQGETVDPAGFFFRDLADHAIDGITADHAGTVATVLGFAETDTLNYRAEPDDPLARRQRELWEPLVTATEVRLGVRFVRLAGIMHRPQPGETLATLRDHLGGFDPFRLAGLATLTSLAASLIVGLAALEPDADAAALFDLSSLEEDWQAERWGIDAEAATRRARRRAQFCQAAQFARL